MAHFSVTPETAIYMCPPYSLSQENDKNKTNRTSLYTSSAGGTCSIFGELRFHMLCGAAIKKKKNPNKQKNKTSLWHASLRWFSITDLCYSPCPCIFLCKFFVVLQKLTNLLKNKMPKSKNFRLCRLCCSC